MSINPGANESSNGQNLISFAFGYKVASDKLVMKIFFFWITTKTNELWIY
jgi:hypothetical protein